MAITRGDGNGENHNGWANGHQGDPLTMQTFFQATPLLPKLKLARFPIVNHNNKTPLFNSKSSLHLLLVEPLTHWKLKSGWLRSRRLFLCCRVLKRRKCHMLRTMLQGSAHDWWLMGQRQHENNPVPFTWENFRDAFYEKYFLESVRRQNEDEFIKLQ